MDIWARKIKGTVLAWFILIWFIFAIIFNAGTAAGTTAIKIITGSTIPVTHLDDQTVKFFFLGQKKAWPDGSAVEVVVQNSGETHHLFLKNYIKKTPAQFNIHWKKRLFSGKDRLPKSFKTDGEVIAYVLKKPGAIGYVSGAADVGSAKTVSEKQEIRP